MLFFPLWVVLISVPCVYAAARYTRNSLATLSVSLAFLSSGALFLLSMSGISGRVSVAYLGGFLPLEISKLPVVVSLIFLVCSMAFLIYFLWLQDANRLSKGATLFHLLIFFALASFYSKGLLSFVIFFEAVPLLAFALLVSEGRMQSPSWQNLLYFVPLPLLLLSTGLISESVSDAHSMILAAGATLLLAVVFASRLILFPFGWPALRCLPLARRAAASYALYALPAVALLALIKFLPYSMPLIHTMLVLAAFSMVAWAVACFRQGRENAGALYAYLAQTSTVALMVTYSVLDAGFQAGVTFVVIANHLAASLGLLLCVSVADEQRGRFGNAALVVFAFCMLGLPPSPGFFGRLALFKASLSATDVPSYLLRLSFLVNLFLVYCQSRYLAVVIGRMTTGPKTPRSLIVSLLLLVACLLLVFHWRSF